MAAYAALVSLMHTIEQIEHHPSPPISLDKKQVESLTKNVKFLQEFLEGYDSPVGDDGEEADPLESRIANAAHAAEDVIESYIVDVIQLAGSSTTKDHQDPDSGEETSSDEEIKNSGGEEASSDEEDKEETVSAVPETVFGEEIISCYQDLQIVIREMDLIKTEVMGIVKGKRVSGVLNQQLRRDDEGQKNTIVGFDDVSSKIIDKLVGGSLIRQVIPIVGMGGIGKTTLAKSICAQRVIKQQFDVCAWATISQEYNILKILNQLLPEKMRDLSETSESELGEKLHKHLSGRRYLIVLDDMWSIEVWYKIRFFFPDSGNCSRIVVTTRLSELGSQLASNSIYVFDMKFLDEASSWNLFSKIVFGEKGCPLELVEIGKNIANNCKGLPLSIVVIGGFLAKSHHTQEYWEFIRDNLNSIVNSDNDEYCLKLLKMSYTQLPAYLKPCFLYMGVFEEDSSIRVPTLVKLWAAEGFLKPITGKSLETAAKEYLKDLIDRNLVLVDDLGLTGDVKYCKIHDLLRDLSLKEAHKERFYHVIRQHNPHQRINKDNQRRLIIPESSGQDHNDIVDAFESMALARSFICDNAEVQLPCSNYRLLRVLKAYEKYSERRDGYFLKNMFRSSVNLRYLAIAPHDKSKFPSSVNLLWNLHTLIVDLSGEVVAPVEIWNMPQLRHVEFLSKGLYLPDPPNNNTLVITENLETLTGIKNLKLSEEVVGRIPNIKKLGVSYDERAKLWPSSYYRLCNLERLQKLESFECRIETGRFLRKVKFPDSLKKLTLEADRMEWEEMLKEIGSLPHLQKLELYFGSFRKRRWRTVDGQFRSLKFLRLFGCRCLKYWRMKSSHFPRLEQLVLAHLKELEEIPSEIGNIPTLKSVGMSKCRASAVESAKEMVKEQEFNYGAPSVEVRVTLWEKDQVLERLASPPYFHVEVI